MKRYLGMTGLMGLLAIAGGLMLSNRASASGASLCPRTGKSCASMAKCTTRGDLCPITGTTCPTPCERCSHHSAGLKAGVL